MSDLWENISSLPSELKVIVGSYSPRVHYLKMFMRHQFFRVWSIENVDRLLGYVRQWKKSQIIWLLNGTKFIDSFHLFMKKEDIINFLRRRFTRGCRPGTNEVLSWCPMHARITWQYLKIIDSVHNLFQQRKRLVAKERKALKRARDEVEEYIKY